MSLESASIVEPRESAATVVEVPLRLPAKGKPLGTRSGFAGQLAVFGGDIFCLAAVAAAAVTVEYLAYGVWSWSLVAPLVGLIVGLLFAFREGRVYASVRRHPVAEFRHTCIMVLALGIAATVSSVVAADHQWAATGLLAAVTFVLFFAMPIMRYVTRHAAARFSWWGRRVVIVGGGDCGVKLYELMRRRPHLGLRPVGIVEDLEQLSLEAKPASYLGPVTELPRIAAENDLSLGVLVTNEGSGKSLDLLHEGGVLPDWLMVAGPADRPGLWIESRELGGMPVLSVRNHLRFANARRLKRALDIALTLCGGFLLLPLLAAIAIAIRWNSKGPVLFRQERMGFDGKKFRAWKFRTMHVNAEQVLHQYLDKHPELKREWELAHKLKNDPRVTTLGKWLRKTSLDELPQLWNVLTGEMSLVGPRPLPNTDVERYDQLGVYTKAVPGITGLWQVSGRSNTTFEERVEYDTFYVRNWSPWFDLYILACTIRVVLIGEGAY